MPEILVPLLCNNRVTITEIAIWPVLNNTNSSKLPAKPYLTTLDVVELGLTELNHVVVLQSAPLL